MCMQRMRTHVSHAAHMHACLWVNEHHAADTIVPGTSPQAGPGQRCIMEWLSICKQQDVLGTLQTGSEQALHCSGHSHHAMAWPQQNGCFWSALQRGMHHVCQGGQNVMQHTIACTHWQYHTAGNMAAAAALPAHSALSKTLLSVGPTKLLV